MSVLAGLIRHALTAVGGGLVANGTISDSDLHTAIGAILTLVGIAASAWVKRQAHV